MQPPSSGSLYRANGTAALGNQLPMVAYHAIERYSPERIHALALYCSDGRWGKSFDEFCHRHLRIPHYDRWAVPGGPAWIALAAEEDGDLFQIVRIQLDFLVQAHELKRIVLITHHGCAWYGHRLQQPPDQCLSAQSRDVEVAAAVLRDWYPDLQVEAYLAMRQHEWVSFHTLDIGERGGTSRR
jgi:hypothetical protein